MSRIRTAVFWLIPSAFFLYFYWYGLQAWFQADDFAWLGLPLEAHGGTPLWKLLFTPKAQGTIRPWSERLFFLVIAGNYGLDPLPFHAAVFLTHAANLFLLQWITLRATASRLAALAAPLLWLCSIGLATPLSWLSSYNQVLCAFFLLAALACLIRAIETGARRWWFAQAVVFLLGFGALEINVVYPALALAWILMFAPRYWLRTAPLFVISAGYAGLHHVVAAKPADGPYARHWDASMVTTFVTYWGNALAGGQILPHWRVPPRAWEIAAWTLAAVLLGYSVAAWRRGNRVPAFGIAWFCVIIGPVLPLRDHFSTYYLAIPGAGLALILASLARDGAVAVRRRHAGYAAMAASVIVLHLSFSIPLNRAVTRWHYNRGQRIMRFVEGLERAHELHPDKAVFLENVDSELYWGAFGDEPFRLFGMREVFLVPGAEKTIDSHPDLGDLTQRVASEAVISRALAWERGVVYRFEESHLRNVTRRYWSAMPKEWLGSRPRLIDAGQPAFARDLGPGWYQLEGNWRWMGRTATVYLAPPGAGEYSLLVAAYRPESATSNEPLNLTVRSSQGVLGTYTIPPQSTSFETTFPLPPPVGGPVFEVTLEVDHTVRVQGDNRELGLAFGQIGIVPRRPR